MTGTRPALFLDQACVELAGDSAARAVSAFRARCWVFVLGGSDPMGGDAAFVAGEGFDRPPRAGMFFRAMTAFAVTRERSLLIAASDNMLVAGRAVGVAGCLFSGGHLASFAEWAWADFDGGR